jgi:hypothetical protein
MGFFATIVWAFFGVIIIVCYLALMGKYVSKGFHIGGKPIAQEKYQSTKTKYNIVLAGIIAIVFVTPFVIPEPKAEPVKIEPKFDVDIKIEAGPSMTFIIKTNLPNETEILIGLDDIETDDILWQAKGEIMDGVVVLGPYPKMDSGKYIFDITIPIIAGQKQSVKNILGKNGENLIGNSIEDFMDSKVINVRTDVEIPE